MEKTLHIEESVGSGPINKVIQICKNSLSVISYSWGCHCLQNMGSTINKSIFEAMKYPLKANISKH